MILFIFTVDSELMLFSIPEVEETQYLLKCIRGVSGVTVGVDKITDEQSSFVDYLNNALEELHRYQAEEGCKLDNPVVEINVLEIIL